ncbi:MAG: FAD-binding oxidoreductase [Gemmatimonadaceae bacterium]
MIDASAATEAMRNLVRDAVETVTPLRIAGASTWMDAGRPVATTRTASLEADARVVDYVPGDFTITVRAGTPLRKIAEVTAREGQWLPLDPYGTCDGTAGATVATGSFGPLAHSFGRARDLVLGVEFVSGEAAIVRGGGRVVKNVAGFDLVRLITGSWGSIGVVTEVTFRLYARPARLITVAVGIPDDEGEAARGLAMLMSVPGIPFAMELVDAATSEHIGVAPRQQLLVMLGGNDAGVAAQYAAMKHMGASSELNPDVWERLRRLEDVVAQQSGSTSPIVVRLSSLPGQVAALWSRVRRVVSGVPGGCVHATPSLGIVRCIIPGTTPMPTVEQIASAVPGATAIFERLPAAEWERLSPSVVADRISQRIKRAFDPSNVLNPGIMGPVT